MRFARNIRSTAQKRDENRRMIVPGGFFHNRILKKSESISPCLKGGVLMPVALEPLCIQIPQFDLARTLDCGQAFRWSRLENGAFHGVAFGWPLTIWQEGEQVFFSCSQEVFDQIWFSYFDLKRDYSALCERFRADAVMRQALDACPGIRILHQEPWEAICSFIISQNNHIPRIKGYHWAVMRILWRAFGQWRLCLSVSGTACGAGYFSSCPPCGLDSGAGYLLDAAKKICHRRG